MCAVFYISFGAHLPCWLSEGKVRHRLTTCYMTGICRPHQGWGGRKGRLDEARWRWLVASPTQSYIYMKYLFIEKIFQPTL